MRIKTGIDGLDELLRDGIELPSEGYFAGRIILIKGNPGTGKSTLALQIASSVANQKIAQKEKDVYYFSCEQTTQDIKEKCSQFNINIGKMKINNYPKKANDSEKEEPFEFRSSKLVWQNTIMEKLHREKKSRLLVIDGLNLMMDRERSLFDIETLIDFLRKNSLISIIVYEDDNKLADSMADMVIELRGEEVSSPTNYYLNSLIISKSRFQRTALGVHQYKIRGKSKAETDNGEETGFPEPPGIKVFPSIHFHLYQSNLMNKQLKKSCSSLKKIYDENTVENLNNQKQVCEKLKFQEILGHLPREGSCTILLGNRNTLKTYLSLDFLKTGVYKSDDEALLITLLDDISITVKQEYCHKHDCKENLVCLDKIFPYYFQPGCITSDEFFYYLRERIKLSDKIKWAAFWDITQIDYKFPYMSNDRMFLTGLIQFFKKPIKESERKITSVIIGSLYSKLTKSAYETADNVVLCWRGCDKDKKEGIYIHADRIEGQPGAPRTVFFYENEKRCELIMDEDLKLKYRKAAESIIKELETDDQVLGKIMDDAQ